MRQDLSDEKLPVLTVQLNRLVIQGSAELDLCWGKIREAQRQAPKHINNVFVIPSLDSSLSDPIHTSSAANMVLGERLLKTALAEIYGRPYIYKAPDIYMALKIDVKMIELHFENVNARLDAFGVPVRDLPFTVIDNDDKVEIVEYEIKNGNAFVLKLVRDLNGKAFVNGAFEMNPAFIVPIDRGSHLPMLAFHGVEIDLYL